jgi:hypothetical protein
MLSPAKVSSIFQLACMQNPALWETTQHLHMYLPNTWVSDALSLWFVLRSTIWNTIDKLQSFELQYNVSYPKMRITTVPTTSTYTLYKNKNSVYLRHYLKSKTILLFAHINLVSSFSFSKYRVTRFIQANYNCQTPKNFNVFKWKENVNISDNKLKKKFQMILGQTQNTL